MGLFDGWPFKSKEQIAKERRQFASRVLPFGDEHKAKALAVLREILTPKLRDDECLYAFISAKDKYSDAETPEEGLQEAQHTLKRQFYLTDDDRRAVLALIRLDTGIESLDAYPSVAAVRTEMALID